jgi:hypothetical protein
MIRLSDQTADEEVVFAQIKELTKRTGIAYGLFASYWSSPKRYCGHLFLNPDASDRTLKFADFIRRAQDLDVVFYADPLP